MFNSVFFALVLKRLKMCEIPLFQQEFHFTAFYTKRIHCIWLKNNCLHTEYLCLLITFIFLFGKGIKSSRLGFKLDKRTKKERPEKTEQISPGTLMVINILFLDPLTTLCILSSENSEKITQKPSKSWVMRFLPSMLLFLVASVRETNRHASRPVIFTGQKL